MRPLVGLNLACAVLNRDTREVVQMAACSQVTMFNIGLSGARPRRCWRFWSRSLKAFLTRQRIRVSGRKAAEQIVADGRGPFNGPQVARILNCSAHHVTHLIRAGELRNHGGGLRPDGRLLIQVTRAELVRFLARRVVR